MNNIKRKIFLFLFFIFICSFVFSLSARQNELKNELLRLHIVANSNSDIDQKVKLIVRDKLIEYSKNTKCENKKDFIKNLEKQLPDYIEIANSCLTESGLPYKASASIERLYIPRKIYNGIVLPKGEYDALVVRLGDSNGENWWCVLYPPLCFTESVVGDLSPDGKKYLKDTLSKNSYDLITSDRLSIKYEFYLLELINSVKEKLNPTKS